MRGVISASTPSRSRLGWSGRLSAKTILAPWRTKASALETKVYEGTMTSSPGPTSARIAAISSASVQLVVSSTLRKPKRCSRKRWHFWVKAPLPEILPDSTAWRM